MNARRGDLVTWQDRDHYIRGRVVKVIKTDAEPWYSVKLTMGGLVCGRAPYHVGESFYISRDVVVDVACDGRAT